MTRSKPYPAVIISARKKAQDQHSPSVMTAGQWQMVASAKCSTTLFHLGESDVLLTSLWPCNPSTASCRRALLQTEEWKIHLACVLLFQPAKAEKDVMPQALALTGGELFKTIGNKKNLKKMNFSCFIPSFLTEQCCKTVFKRGRRVNPWWPVLPDN